MKIYITLFFLLVGFTSLFSQQDDKALVGNWMFTSCFAGNQPMNDGMNYKEYCVFKENGTFDRYSIQIVRQINPIKIDTNYTHETGKWDIDKNILKTTIKETWYNNMEFETFREKYRDTIAVLTDSKLTLISDLEWVTMNYERTTIDPKIIFDSLPLPAKHVAVPLADVELCCGDTLPKNQLKVYRKNPDKIKWIPNYSDVTIKLYPSSTPLIAEYNESVSGTFVTVDRNKLVMNIGYTMFYGYDTTQAFVSGSRNYYFSDIDTTICREIMLKDINYISYASPFRTTVNEVSAATLFLSCLSALVVSPLVSLQKDGGFNGPKYMRWAGWSLVGVSLSLPLHIFSYPRQYKVKGF